MIGFVLSKKLCRKREKVMAASTWSVQVVNMFLLCKSFNDSDGNGARPIPDHDWLQLPVGVCARDHSCCWMGIFSPPLAHFANHLRATQFADASSLVVSDIILVNPHSHCLFFPFCDCVLWQPHVERRQPWTDRGERWWQSRKKKIPPEKKPLRSLIRPQCQIALSAITQAVGPSFQLEKNGGLKSFRAATQQQSRTARSRPRGV